MKSSMGSLEAVASLGNGWDIEHPKGSGEEVREALERGEAAGGELKAKATMVPLLGWW